ncbi:MAG: imidazolonepropionase [Saprospiraceae bacterium]|nr:imidazolonepropionase [Saprospiraceae bacterium]
MALRLITNIHSIFGVTDENLPLMKGKNMKEVGVLNNAYLLFDKKIIDYGPMDQCPQNVSDTIDAEGGSILPSWCDSHTHIVYAGSRENEYVMRLQGKTYEEIAAAGGGILNSASKMTNADENTLYNDASERLNEVIKTGTGAIEIKSGYGLSFESEVKMLRVIKKLKENSDAEIKATFLGAHAIPAMYKQNRSAYITLITDTMIPYIAENQLADYCDVFCDEGFFSVKETDTILEIAAKFGLKAKIHANELANSGGVQIGIKHNAISVDHLERIGDDEIYALLQSDTIPTALPNASFFLQIPYSPCRKMIDAGLGVALASDFNPGSSPSGNIPLLLSIACNHMKLLPEEAFNAATINGAHAMEVADHLGSITKGKSASFMLTTPIPNLSYMVYRFGTNHINKVWLKGNLQQNW